MGIVGMISDFLWSWALGDEYVAVSLSPFFGVPDSPSCLSAGNPLPIVNTA